MSHGSVGSPFGYRAPQRCPVCADELHVTQLSCDACGTGISGHFQNCDFCALEDAELDVLRVFLASRGNMKELERHLGVSYPTARARFDELLAKLGLRGASAEKATSPQAAASQRSAAGGGPTSSSATDGRGPGNQALGREPGRDDPSSSEQRLAALQALAAGTLDVDAARRLID